MKRVALFLTIILVAGLIGPIVQAKELTLDDCIELALKNRASIIKARGAASAAGADKTAALGAFLPSVRASYSYSKGKETGIDPANIRVTEYETVLDTTDIGGQVAVDAVQQPVAYELSDAQDIGPRKTWYIGADMDIFNLANWFDYAAAAASKASAELNVLASEQDMIQAVKVAYYAYLAAEQNLNVQEEAAQRAEEQLKLIESKFELGSASKSDVLKQKVQFGSDRLELLRAKDGVVQYRADLAYTIGLDPREDHQFSAEYAVSEYTGTMDEAISYSLSHNPSVLSSEKTAGQTLNSLRSAKARYLPTVTASASYSKFNGTQAYPTAFDYASTSKSIGFTVSLSIFDGFLRERQVSYAGINRNNALASLADTRNYTVNTVKTTHFEITQLKTQMSVSQENVAAAEEDLRITQEKYDLGAATILDLLDAQVSLKEAQVALIQVQFDLNLAIARLENAMGKR